MNAPLLVFCVLGLDVATSSVTVMTRLPNVRHLREKEEDVTACHAHSMPHPQHITPTAHHANSTSRPQHTTPTARHAHSTSCPQHATPTACHAHSMPRLQHATPTAHHTYSMSCPQHATPTARHSHSTSGSTTQLPCPRLASPCLPRRTAQVTESTVVSTHLPRSSESARNVLQWTMMATI